MTLRQRIKNLIEVLFLVICGIILLFVPDSGYLVVFAFLSLSWLLYSLRLLIYYFTMARFMVGGVKILLRGVFFMDLSVLALALSDVNKIYIMIYLVMGMMFSNAIEIFRAMDARKCGASNWKWKLCLGVIGILLAMTCMVNCQSPTLAGDIYAVELFYSATIRTVNIFRNNQVVYVHS